MQPRKIIHIITGLAIGGAEMMLYKLLSHLDRSTFDAEVISLISIGSVGRRIQELGISVKSLGMDPGKPNPLAVIRLARWINRSKPELIQTWMYHADLIGGLAAKLAGGIPVIWGIYNTDLSLERTKLSTIWTARASAHLSRWLPKRIITCSRISQQAHIELGYEATKMRWIPIGFDMQEFKPDPEARFSVRRELGLSEEEILIGLIARFDPQKDHHNFIQAASLLHEQRSDVHYLLCGSDITWENTTLVKYIADVDLQYNFHLLGMRDDVPRLTTALDLATSASVGEAFPSVIGEAMICGVPCVVTDVGDSAMIVGDTGKVVPSRDPKALAMAWLEFIQMGSDERVALGLAARRRVEQKFSLPEVVARYQGLYMEVLAE